MSEKDAPSCDWRQPEADKKIADKKEAASRLLRHNGAFSWRGVKTERYKAPDGTWSDVIRKTLVGEAGEKTKFHLRYFEIAPGGHTSLEYHKHEHVVIGARGEGKCRINGKLLKVGFMDTVYIAPNDPHQLINPTDEPFGFFCIVDAKRDRPKKIENPE